MDDNHTASRHVPLLDDGGDYSSSSATSNRGTSSTPMMQRLRPGSNPRLYILITLILLAVCLIGLVAVIIRRDEEPDAWTGAPLSSTRADACQDVHATRRSITAAPRASDGVTASVLLRNGTIHDGRGSVFMADLYLSGGLIVDIGPGLSHVANTTLDLRGAHVTPGLIDLHSHIGVYSWPGDLWATQDGNEMTNPIFPQVRALDAFNPQDPAIAWMLRGGVTTSNILPGSGNAMGGEATIIKHKSSNYINDLLMPGAPRAIKQACGENPKRVYGFMGQTPMSRMGSAWLMRQAYEQAADLLRRQRDWCAMEEPQGPFPASLALDPLVGLLQGEVRLHQHCYKSPALVLLLLLLLSGQVPLLNGCMRCAVAV